MAHISESLSEECRFTSVGVDGAELGFCRGCGDVFEDLGKDVDWSIEEDTLMIPEEVISTSSASGLGCD